SSMPIFWRLRKRVHRDIAVFGELAKGPLWPAPPKPGPQYPGPSQPRLSGCVGAASHAKAGVPGHDDRVGPVADVELREDAGDVVTHRLGAHVEHHRDGAVVMPSGDQLEHLVLAAGEVCEGATQRSAARVANVLRNERPQFREELAPGRLVL